MTGRGGRGEPWRAFDAMPRLRDRIHRRIHRAPEVRRRERVDLELSDGSLGVQSPVVGSLRHHASGVGDFAFNVMALTPSPQPPGDGLPSRLFGLYGAEGRCAHEPLWPFPASSAAD